MIPSLFAAIAARKILDGQLRRPGIVALPEWISQEELQDELERRGVDLLVSEDQEAAWTRVARGNDARRSMP